MVVLKTVLAALAGLILGYFIKYCSGLLCLSGARLCRLRPCCFICGEKMSPADCVGQLITHRLCAECGNRLPTGYHLTEAAVAVIYAAGALIIPDTFGLIVFCVLTAVLVTAAAVDVRIMKVPYFCSLCVLIVGTVIFIASAAGGDGQWKSMIAGAVLAAVLLAVPAFMGGIGGGDLQFLLAGSFVLGLKGTALAFLITVLSGAAGSAAVVIADRHSHNNKYTSVISDTLSEWYSIQKENGKALPHGAADTVYFRVTGRKINAGDIGHNSALWQSEPDIELLGELLSGRSADVPAKLSVTVRLEQRDDGGTDIQVKCRRIIALAPYISAGIIVAYLLCI